MPQQVKLTYADYGGPEVLSLHSQAVPAPGPDEVLVETAAAGINELDWKLRNGTLRAVDGFGGWPRGVGLEFAGTVRAVGTDVMGIQAGQQVFGWLDMGDHGAFATHVLAKADLTLPLPAGGSLTDLAALPMTGTTALRVLDDAAPLEGKRVLVNGGTGGVGHYLVQLAKRGGAHVTVTTSGSHAAFAKTLGADTVYDYHETDITDTEERFDLIVDASKKLPWDDARPLLTATGTYADLQPSPGGMVGSKLHNLTHDTRRIVYSVSVERADLERLAQLVGSGQLQVTVGATYPFEEVIDVLARAERGELDGVGKQVLTFN